MRHNGTRNQASGLELLLKKFSDGLFGTLYVMNKVRRRDALRKCL